MLKALIMDAGQVLARSELRDQWNIPPRAREIIGARADVIGTSAWCEACKKEALLVREDILLGDVRVEYAMRRAFVEAVDRDLGGSLTPGEIDALAEDLTYNPDRYTWYDDVLPAWRRLKGKVKLAVLSDALPSMRGFIEGFDREHMLDVVVLSTEVGATKPSPIMYRTVLEKLGLPGGDCLFIDDRACNLRGAEPFGIHCAQMLRFDGMEADYPRAIRTMEEAEEIIKNTAAS